MTVEIISWSTSTKVWDLAGIEIATPGSAVRLASVARHVIDCTTRPSINFCDNLECVYVKYKSHASTARLVCLFCCFTSQVNSYGHGGTVSSPNHTFFLGKIEQAVNQYLVHILSLVTDNNPSWMIQGKGECLSTEVWDRAGIKLATLDLQSDSHLLPDTLPPAQRGHELPD